MPVLDTYPESHENFSSESRSRAEKFKKSWVKLSIVVHVRNPSTGIAMLASATEQVQGQLEPHDTLSQIKCPWIRDEKGLIVSPNSM